MALKKKSLSRGLNLDVYKDKCRTLVHAVLNLRILLNGGGI